jgi:hypothetical protein
MPTPTYDLIASNVLGSSAASVTFSSIPATYRDLVLVVEAAVVSSSNDLYLRFNGDTGSNYSEVTMRGADATSTSATRDAARVSQSGIMAAAKGLIITQILDYSATDKHKTLLSRSGGTNGVNAIANRWANTSAITSIYLLTDSQNFAAGASFYLYGIVS